MTCLTVTPKISEKFSKLDSRKSVKIPSSRKRSRDSLDDSDDMACLVQNVTPVDSNSYSSWSPLNGGGKLDQEAIQYIHKFYCKDCRMEAERAKANAAAAGGNSNEQTPAPPTSPQASLEEMSLQQSMDRNKESLKRKLMLRRSVNELVDQGIYPPLKTPPAFAEQQKKLERAKTGDLLKHKIQQRPDRSALVQQHILEDTSPKIDPSLADRQRQLKRARLLDGLNVRLSHRPGPLELVQSNILPSENNIKEAINDGILTFNRTFDSEQDGSESHFTFDEDSNNSEGAPSPPQNDDSGMSDVSSPNPNIPPAPELPPNFCKQKVALGQIPTFTTVTTSVPISNSAQTATVIAHSGNNITSPKNGSTISNGNHITKARPKKQKLKTQPKSKVIKFHEYKGPPNAKSPSAAQPVNPANNSETPYHILLQQQQLFLQWQLEIQQKNMPFLLSTQPAAEGQPAVSLQHSPVSIQSNVVVTTVVPSVSKPPIQTTQVVSQSIPPPPPPPLPKTPIPSVLQQPRNQIKQSTPPPPSPTVTNQNSAKVEKSVSKPLTNLEEMKVADLKAELKKRNLPVSGSKPQLIERLKPFTDTITNSQHGSVITSSENSSIPKLKPIDPSSIKTEIKTESICSPEDFSNSINSPSSPPFLEHALTPMSPELMDLSSSMSTQQIRNSLDFSQNTIPMNVDRSRPPSAVPMDLAPMEIDHVINDSSSLASFQSIAVTPQSSCSRPESTSSLPSQLSPQSPLQQFQVSPVSIPNPSPVQWQVPASPQQPPQPLQIINQSHIQQQQPLQTTLPQQIQLNLQKQNLITQQQFNTIIQNDILNSLSPPPSVGNNTSVPHEELLKQQQQKIADLQRQLEELQQLQQQHQHHLQTTLLKQPPSPQIQNNVQITTGVCDSQNPILQQISANTTAISHPLSQSLVQPCETVTIPTTSFSSMTFTSGSDVIKSNLPSVMKSPPIQQNLEVTNLENTIGKALPNILLSTSIPCSVSSSLSTVLNGLTTTVARSSSVPPTSDEGGTGLHRTVSAPFFAYPMKEPPKYHEAIKTLKGKQPQIKQQSIQKLNNNNNNNNNSTVTTATSSSVSSSISFPGNLNIRSQEMDDLLDILIKNGELPPSALLTPKTECVSLPTVSATLSEVATSDATKNIASCSVVSSGHNSVVTSSVPLKLVNDNNISLESTSRKKDVTLPLITNTTDNDFLELNAMLNSDFTGMDWTSENFSSLELPDTNIPTETVKNDLSQDYVQLHVPSPGVSKANPSGSEPDLVTLGLNENETPSNMQIDVSDWLDVIMPNTGLTPLSANAPVSFTSDPVLSPKSNQEVYDLFSFDDSELTNVSDSHCTLNWDKLTEASTSS